MTGSDGSLGKLVMADLSQRGFTPIPFDLSRGGDVLDQPLLMQVAAGAEADAAIHLAADKHAPQGELHPERIAELNIEGTANVVRSVPRVVLASTCKAAAPITCYGASKLIAERIVLNAGGTVVRLVNCVGSAGSVAEIWDSLPDHAPLPVTLSQRMYITPEAAADLLVRALDLPAGRYGPAAVEKKATVQLARELHPGRSIQIIPLRNGDRPIERLTNDDESAIPFGGGFVRILDCWEGESEALAA